MSLSPQSRVYSRPPYKHVCCILHGLWSLYESIALVEPIPLQATTLSTLIRQTRTRQAQTKNQGFTAVKRDEPAISGQGMVL